MLMPSRATSNGRHGDADTRPSARKPNSVLAARLSTPPTIAASTRPASIIRFACANTFALDEHAVDVVDAGPPAPSASATNAVVACR